MRFMHLSLLGFAISFANMTQAETIRVKKLANAEEAESLCREKAAQAADAVAQINNPGATKKNIVLKNTSAAKSDSWKASFTVPMAHDDKTKIYSVDVEFSKSNKWCQVTSVKLVGMSL